jgi:hypothetical protein
MNDARQWTYAALFGALWGALEASVGTFVHLGRMPLRGMLMGILGLLCLICLRRLQPRPGVCLLAGLVAVFLKIFTLGGLYPGPLIGIMVEALVVELAMTLSGGRALGAVLGGAVTLGTNPVQKLAMTWLVAGSEAMRSVVDIGEKTFASVGLQGLGPVTILTAIVAAEAVVGALGGLWAWRVAGRVARRVGERS